MAVYYLDTSALAKRYAAEVGTAWVQALVDPATGHDLYTVRLTGPEMIAALARKVRTGQLAPAEAARAAAAFKANWQRQYQIIELTSAVADRAMDLADQHGLRGYDAVHLAAGLELEDRRRALGLPPLTFVSADRDQLQAAAVEGLPIDDPNSHP